MDFKLLLVGYVLFYVLQVNAEGDRQSSYVMNWDDIQNEQEMTDPAIEVVEETSDPTTEVPTTTPWEPPEHTEDPPRTTTENITTTEYITTTENIPTTHIVPTTIKPEIPTTEQIKPTQIPPCRQCEEVDMYGQPWKGCPGRISKTCALLKPNSRGIAVWDCGENGKFLTRQPNVDGCNSEWVGSKQEEIKNINTTTEAINYTNNLTMVVLDALSSSNSTNNYFGHEISNISSILDQVLSKKDLTWNITSLEPVVNQTININRLLIHNRGPWETLENQDKSRISTEVLSSSESAMFNLTNIAKEEYSRFFHIEDKAYSNVDEDMITFIDVFFKNNEEQSGRNAYEFPSNANSENPAFIRLPDGWQDLIEEDKIQIAAMSFNAEVISGIMPGQYDEILSSNQLENRSEVNNNTKLINGRLISFSLGEKTEFGEDNTESTSRTEPSTSAGPSTTKEASTSKEPLTSEDPSTSQYPSTSKHHPTSNGPLFSEKSTTGLSAQLHFQHEVQAWGDEKYNIRRKLHEGEIPKAVKGTAKCMFWDVQQLTWSQEGCQLIEISASESICECSHLTSFAILMDVHNYIGKQPGLEELTFVLCPLSMLCLLITIIFTFKLKNPELKIRVVQNLSICLLLGLPMILFVLDRHFLNLPDEYCIGFAIWTHYIFLAAFMWMLLYAIVLLSQVRGMNLEKVGSISLLVVAYGTPALIVGATAAVGFSTGDKPYGGDAYCWLEGPYIWSFVGPVGFVILANLLNISVFLIIIIRNYYGEKKARSQLTKRHDTPNDFHTKIRELRTWILSYISLSFLLGITWVFGFFTMMHFPMGLIAAYLFTILNASQGIFIFFCHCLYNRYIFYSRSTKHNIDGFKQKMLPQKIWLTSFYSRMNRKGKNISTISNTMDASTQTTEVFDSSQGQSGNSGVISSEIVPIKKPSMDYLKVDSFPKQRIRFLSTGSNASKLESDIFYSINEAENPERQSYA